MKGEARRREGRLRRYDCDRDSETVIATGRSRRAARPPAAWWRRREMQRSYERRRWLRDGGRGGAGLSRRGACCCGVSVVNLFCSLLLGRRQREQPPTAARRLLLLCSAPAKPGTKTRLLPFALRRKSPPKKKRDARTRVFCVGLAAWRPMPGGFFFSLFLIKAAPVR